MRTTLAIAVISGLTFVAACNREPDVDDVPMGSDVQLTREDGALVEGRLTDRDPETVRVDVGRTTTAVPRREIADFRLKTSDALAEPPPAAKFREVTVAEDTPLSIRLTSRASSASSKPEDVVRGTLLQPVVVDSVTAIPAGAELSGVVTTATPSGKVKGRASLALQFDRLAAEGTSYPVSARFARTAAATRGNDAEKIAIPATGGAIIGAIIGGNKGAAIGAAAGGGVGTAVVLSTTGDEVVLEEGTTLELSAGRPIVVRVPLR